MSLLTSACLRITACTWLLKRPSWPTGSVRREEHKPGVRTTEEADKVESRLAKMGLKCSLAKMSAEALRPCASVWIKARMAGASRSWRSWKESEAGSLSTPTKPPSNESITDVVINPLLAISSESISNRSGTLARRGALERRDLSGSRSMSSWERRRVAVGIAKWERGRPLVNAGFPGRTNLSRRESSWEVRDRPWRGLRVVGSNILLDAAHGRSHHGWLAQTRSAQGQLSCRKAGSQRLRSLPSGD